MAGSNLKDTLYGGVAVVHVPGLQGPKGEDAVVTPSMQKLHDEAIAAATTAESARIAAQTAEQHAVEVGADIDSDRVVTEEAASKAIASAQSSESSATAASRYADIVMENKTALDVVAANKTAFTSTVTHVNDVITISEHIDEVHTVGQDLQGVNADSLDLGSVADSIDQITTVTDGYIKKVAEHIDDCVHPVSLHLDAIETVAENLGVIIIDDALSTTSVRAVQNKVVTAALAAKADSSSLAKVATSGKYADLSGTPALVAVATSGKYSDLTGTPSLATVATTGKYSDLSGTPALATVATSGSYTDLTNKPTKVSAFTNDAGYLTSVADASITTAKLADTIDLGSM